MVFVSSIKADRLKGALNLNGYWRCAQRWVQEQLSDYGYLVLDSET